MRTIHNVTRVNSHKFCHIPDMGGIPLADPFHIEISHPNITDFYRKVHVTGVGPLSVGGGHSITLPILRAIAADRPHGMVHIVVYTDTCDEDFQAGVLTANENKG